MIMAGALGLVLQHDGQESKPKNDALGVFSLIPSTLLTSCRRLGKS